MCAPVATAQYHHHHPDQAGSEVADHGTIVRRRTLLRAGAAVAGGAAIVAGGSATPATAFPKRARRTADLTHRLVRTFPSFFGPQVVFDEVVNDFPTSGFFSKRWTLEEHIGTHIDTPVISTRATHWSTRSARRTSLRRLS